MQKANTLLQEHLALLLALDHTLPVLDLACGTGRNGLLLAAQGIPVVFADKSSSALKMLDQQLLERELPGFSWEVDLEKPGVTPFGENSFSAIIVFRYLHRPLFPVMRNAIMPGGLVIYETFTIANLTFGRPNNPDFLLQAGELETAFQDWEIIHYFEGLQQKPDREIAQIVARKPAV